MSMNSYLELYVHKTTEYKSIDIINVLIASGWKLKDKTNKISYLPIGDKDDYNWQSDVISKDTLREILIKKEAMGELIGVILYWKESDIGIIIIIDRTNEIIIDLSINRKTLGNKKKGLTDVNWYIENIIEHFILHEYKIERFIFDQF